MIAFFPEIYPDELLYSQLARYHAHSGYMIYRSTAEDLFMNPTVRPEIDFVNRLSLDALNNITRTVSIESIIEKHTMFAYYGRFLNQDRRNSAFRAMVSMQGNYVIVLCAPIMIENILVKHTGTESIKCKVSTYAPSIIAS